jgi:plastocyanin
MRKTVTALAVAAAVALLAASAAASSTRTVRIADFRFSPTSLTISAGTRVHWRWTGSAPHSVKVKSGPARFNSGVKTHGTFDFTFHKRGTYRLMCAVHPFMTMRITVR